MTISSTVRKAGPFDGTGSQTEFPFEFKVFSAGDLYVVQYNKATEVETVLELDSDYTVTLNADQDNDPGGTIELTSALAVNYTLTITSSLANLQPTDLTNRGGFYPSVINDALDRACIQIQQLQDETDRTLKTAISVPDGVDNTLPMPAANMVIGWDNTGVALKNWSVNDLVTSVAYGSAKADVFTGDGETVDFYLELDPASINNLDVSVGGVCQVPIDDYTWTSGTKVTFTTAPPDGETVLIRYMQALPTGTVTWANVYDAPFIDKYVYINQDTTISTAVNMLEGGMFYIASGKTLTINGPFSCGLFQCFSGAGSVVFNSDVVNPNGWFAENQSVTFNAGLRAMPALISTVLVIGTDATVYEVYPEWWGAIGDGITDCYAAIQSAIDACAPAYPSNKKKLQFTNGIYKLTDTPLILNGGITICGSGFHSVLYQTGTNKDCLQYGTLKGDIIEGVTLRDLSLVATTGARYGLHINEVVRSYFENLHITSPSADIYTTGMILNTWNGVKLSYAAFNENPIYGITLPSLRAYGLKVVQALGTNSYTTNAWNGLVVEGHSTGGVSVDGGSTNTYTNLTIEGETGYGLVSSSEWDVFNGIYFEAITGDAFKLSNTQKVTISNLFSNIENIVLSNSQGTFINCRANVTIDNVSSSSTFINCDGELTYGSNTINYCGYNQIINSSFTDTYHKIDYVPGGRAMSAGAVAGFSGNAPRMLQEAIVYGVTPPTSGRWGAGDKVWFSKENAGGNLGPDALGPPGAVCVNRFDTTLSASKTTGDTSIALTSGSGTSNKDTIGITLDDGTIHWTSISSGGGTNTVVIASGLPSAAASGKIVYTNRWNMMAALTAIS